MTRTMVELAFVNLALVVLSERIENVMKIFVNDEIFRSPLMSLLELAPAAM